MGRVMKYVIKEGPGTRLTCCLPTMPGNDACDRPSYDLYRVVINYAASWDEPYRAIYTFCCERHRQMFIWSHRKLGGLPPGYRLSA